MNSFIVIIGIALVVAGAVLSAFRDRPSKIALPSGRVRTGMIILGVALMIFGASFIIVPTGYTGVRSTFGQISEKTVHEGFNFKAPFVQQIELVNNKRCDVTIASQIWGETVEKTPVYAEDVVITYQIAKDKSAWLYANVSDVNNSLISSSLVASSIKSATAELPVSEVTVRSKIEPLAKERLQESLDEKYGENTVTVYKLIINNMDFEDSYNEAIAAKSIAQQNYEKQLIENETALSKAEADKQVAITNAQAEAEAAKIRADAEAEANKKLTSSLNDDILKAKFYEKWDGKMPQVMGDNTVITDITGSGN